MNTYKNKKIFILGCTGFKGSWLCSMLLKMGATIKGYSLEPETDPNHFSLLNLQKDIEFEVGDIRNYVQLHHSIKEFRPDLVINMAAQALVRRSFREPMNTFTTNMVGVLNLLEICRNSNITKALLNITTDKVYRNENRCGMAYNEFDPLGGFDPYSTSKACSELLTASYRDSFLNDNGIFVATARGGNCVAGGDWSEDRIMPDIMNASRDNSVVILRNPNSIRPWTFVLDTLSGYLLLGTKLIQGNKEFVGAWNFGSSEEDFISVENLLKEVQKSCNVRYDIQQEKNKSLKETNVLKLDSTKAEMLLGWHHKCGIKETIEKTVKWYLEYYNNGKIITDQQIDKYLEDVYSG